MVLHVQELKHIKMNSKMCWKSSWKCYKPAALVGGIRSKKTMQNILENTQIEIISLSRPLICQPNFPKKMQSGDIEDSACISCNGCYSSNCHRCVIRKKK